jgi:integrase
MGRQIRGRGEGTVYQRKSDGKWCASLWVAGNKRRTIYGATKKEVTDKLKDAQAATKKALPVPSARETVGSLLDHWLNDVAAKKVKPSTLERYRRDAELHIRPALGKCKLNELTPRRVQEFIDGLTTSTKPKGRGRQKQQAVPAPLGPRGVAHCRAVLRVALGLAEHEGLIGLNAARRVTLPRQTRKKVEALSPADAKTLLAAFKGHALDALITVALATGLRQGELLELSWADIDFDAATVRVHHQLQRVGGEYQLVGLKTDQSNRTLPLPTVAVAVLRSHRTRQAEARLMLGRKWKDTGLVFTTAEGNYLNGSAVTHRFQDQLRTAGLPVRSFHELRHGAASLLLAQGATMRTVMEQLGHSQINLTMNTYAHIVPEILRDAADKLNEALSE